VNFRPFALIISPLVNLMEEHVRKFRTLFPFLKATHVSSLQSDDSIPDRVRRGEFDVVWMSPETILLDIWLNAFSSGDFPDRLVGVFYDEVHCVTKWGHEFRPDYLLLGVVRARLPLNVPIGGFTATLTPKARIEVVQSLGMLNHATYELSVNRPNIFLARYPYTSAEDGRFFLLQPLIKGLNKRGAGYPRTLIYCRTKDLARSLAMALADAVGDHGGLVTGFTQVSVMRSGCVWLLTSLLGIAKRGFCSPRSLLVSVKIWRICTWSGPLMLLKISTIGCRCWAGVVAMGRHQLPNYFLILPIWAK